MAHVRVPTWGPPGDRTSPWRLLLEQELDGAGPPFVVVMVNPSLADDVRSDPTWTRCLGFAQRAGASRLVVANLFALRTPAVRELGRAADPVGPGNDEVLRELGRRHAQIVCAWGPPSKVARGLRGRFLEVPPLLAAGGAQLQVLALTNGGHPAHPLMLPRSCEAVGWVWVESRT